MEYQQVSAGQPQHLTANCQVIWSQSTVKSNKLTKTRLFSEIILFEANKEYEFPQQFLYKLNHHVNRIKLKRRTTKSEVIWTSYCEQSFVRGLYVSNTFSNLFKVFEYFVILAISSHFVSFQLLIKLLKKNCVSIKHIFFW